MQPNYVQFLDVSIEICIIFLIFFMPLAFGGVGIGSQMILVAISGLIIILWLIKIAKSGQKILPLFPGNIFGILFSIFLAIIAFQFFFISVSPQATIWEFFKIVSYGFLVFVIVKNFNEKTQITRFLSAIAVAGFLMACFGIIQKLTWNGMIYWIVPVVRDAAPFGPFVNKNHFAGFMELTLPIAVLLIFVSKEIEKRILYCFMALIMLTALLMSVSRAGISSLFMAVFLVLLLARTRHYLRRYVFFFLTAIFLVCIGILIITKNPIAERFSGSPENVMWRLKIYKDIFKMFSEFPLFGIGIGAFGAAFGRYSSLGSNIVFVHGESDWMQFLAELGLVGFLCIAIFVWLFFKDILYCHLLGRGRCIFESRNAAWQRHDRFVLLVIMAGLISTISIILHGIFDTNLHIPSNGMLACIIASILTAAAHNSFKV